MQSQLTDQPPAPKIKGSLSSNKLNSEQKSAMHASFQKPSPPGAGGKSNAVSSLMSRNVDHESTSKSLRFLKSGLKSSKTEKDGLVSSKERVTISGDDIIIEYCERMV